MELHTHHSLGGTLHTMYGTTNKRIKDMHDTASQRKFDRKSSDNFFSMSVKENHKDFSCIKNTVHYVERYGKN
jgi:hypothetical protein